MLESAYGVFTVGVVAISKGEDGDEISFFPIEHLSETDGHIDLDETITTVTENILGQIEVPTLTKSTWLSAKWKPVGQSNRYTAPNVRRGELVLVYRYGNTEELYWDTLGHFPEYRRKEKVKYVYGNYDDFNNDITDELSYWYSIDTINKLVEFHTGYDDNGSEHTKYDFTIETKEGMFTAKDDRGNIVTMDSKEDIFNQVVLKEYNLEVGEYTTLTVGKDHTVDIGEYCSVKIGKDYSIGVGENKNLTIGKDHSVKVSGSSKLDVGGKYDITLSKYSVSNGSAELITTLSNLITHLIAAMGMGNLGKPVPFDPGTIANLQKDLADIESFK